MTIISDEAFDKLIHDLSRELLALLIHYSNNVDWKVIGKREHLDFQFDCRLGGKMRKTSSLDFTMASSIQGWRKILDLQAKMVVESVNRMA